MFGKLDSLRTLEYEADCTTAHRQGLGYNGGDASEADGRSPVAANDVTIAMKTYLSLRFERALAPAEESSLLAGAQDAGWEMQLCKSERFGRSYALLRAVRDAPSADFAQSYSGAQSYEEPLLALAIEPEAREALPSLVAALGGPGAPEGVVRAESRSGILLLEFSPRRTSWRLVRALFDVELRRFGSTVRRTTLLSPLSPEMEAQIAADGLEEPQLDQSRVLEALIADVDH